MRKSTLALALLMAGCATVFAEDMRMPINSDEVKWGPAPPNIPAGSQIAVLAGDPSSDETQGCGTSSNDPGEVSSRSRSSRHSGANQCQGTI